MADMVIGPFLVRNANAAQLNDVRAVVARLPANMKSGQTIINFGDRPRNAPDWAEGFNQGPNSFWVNGKSPSSTRQYVIAHEYWHAWSRTHNEQEASVRQLLVGQFGHTETKSWTNDPDEGLADAFAKAMGFRAFPKYDWRVYVPNYQYQHFLDLLGGSTYTPPPPPTGTPAGQPTGDPQKDGIRQFLNWWNQNPLSHNALSSWDGILNEYTSSTGNTQSAGYVRDILTALHIQTNVALGPYDAGSGHIVYEYLKTFSGWTPADLPSGGLVDWSGLFSFLDPIIGEVSHGFYFVLVLIIGVVLLIVGMKAREPKGEAA